MAFIPTIMTFAPLVASIFGIHPQINSESLTEIFNNIANLTEAVLIIVGTCISGWGVIRKIYNTIYDIVHPTA